MTKEIPWKKLNHVTDKKKKTEKNWVGGSAKNMLSLVWDPFYS